MIITTTNPHHTYTNMLSTLDILYIVLAFCAIAITVMLMLLGSEVLRIMRDVRSISRSVEEISLLVQRVARVVFPGVERVAKDVSNVEEKIHHFFNGTSRKKRKD